MPDAKRKLPVLWIGSSEVGYLDRDSWCQVTALVSNRQTKRSIEYEPAVPRCRTCQFFGDVTGPVMKCCTMHASFQVEQDGSGYCHMHPEARNG